MNPEQHLKVTASHLKRLAYLYVRQSTLRQVLENTESTKRQYALRERAVVLGWPPERIVVIDRDLGLSGADSDREGFQQLVAAVGLGEVGGGPRLGGLPPGPQLGGLAPPARDLRPFRYPHPGRGRPL
ncbi:MAG: recombinase family protein [Thermoleophilia bacterium]|nr:recombinase family protein [Thermoleophilia bacterium]